MCIVVDVVPGAVPGAQGVVYDNTENTAVPSCASLLCVPKVGALKVSNLKVDFLCVHEL